MSDKKKHKKWKLGNISVSAIFIAMVMSIVVIFSAAVLLIFVQTYKNAMEKNAITNSSQVSLQVSNMVENYTADMQNLMKGIVEHIRQEKNGSGAFIQNMVEMREDIVAITTYDVDGNLLNCWSNGQQLKENNWNRWTYSVKSKNDEKLNITKPHVESLFVDYYPWVVTVYQTIEGNSGREILVTMDIRFSNIANYIANVGIGEHGYVYIADLEGNLVYHPQQQLIYSGIKQEKGMKLAEGTHVESDVIYTVKGLDNCEWKIVGVCYVDEIMAANIDDVVSNILILIAGILLAVFLLGWAFSKFFSAPIHKLTSAMGDFEKNAESFVYEQVDGTIEIERLSASFGHMVIRIQELMEKVREEETNLRKTELKALQAQINPHFLYNTLDAIAWMCEAGKNEEAEEMVTSLARLFRISISKGHELIPIAKEVEHAKSYLKIEKYRYKNRFNYTFEVQEECLPYLCNKITLQPIIENAIYHGVNQMLEEGEIHIKIYQDGEDVFFQIRDNGVGMTEKRCREILHKEPGDDTGIGIKNVNDRIQIYFGDSYGLSIESELDEGTCVTIHIPKLEEEEYERK